MIDSNQSQILMTFDPFIGSEEMQFGDRFINIHGYPVEVTEMKFYLSDINLLSADGNIHLSDIELLDIRNNIRTLSFNIPPGNYTGIQFDLGVPSELNGTHDPNFTISDYSPNHPLSESSGMYWGWAGGYRFFTIGGLLDTMPNAYDVLPMTFSLHSGNDTLYRELPTFTKAISVRGNEVEVVPFAIQVDSVFSTFSDTIDLKYERVYHGSEAQIELGTKIANNTAASFRLLE